MIRWPAGGTILTAVALALLPKCPACLAGYASVLASLGFGLLPAGGTLVEFVLVALLLTGVASLGFVAWRFSPSGPFAAGCLAASLVIGGRYGLDSRSIVVSGIGLLVAACFWKPRAVSRGRRLPSFRFRTATSRGSETSAGGLTPPAHGSGRT